MTAIPDSGLAVVVYKGAKTLAVYRDGRLDKRYSVVLGKRPNGRKHFAGDMRTPEGSYHVTTKRMHPRWHYFIAIDYPNDDDRERYRRELEAGMIPAIGGTTLGIGGGLGIHGNDRPVDQANGSNWTQGCVAMRNKDVTELYRLIDVGTPVLFLP